MNDFYINPLSVNEQCHSADDILGLMNTLVECFEYLLPAINKDRTRLFFDSSIENRRFITAQHFLTSINSLQKDDRDEQDVKKLWFVYTRNRAEKVSLETASTTVSALHYSEQFEGFISNDEMLKQAKWLSVGGQPLSEAVKYNVLQGGRETFTVTNAHHLDSLKPLLPRYEPNDKHRKEPYFASGGEKVAPMPLNIEDAQHLLLESIKENNDRWAYHGNRRKFYRFKLTHPDQNIYHGFEIEENEISAELIKKLR